MPDQLRERFVALRSAVERSDAAGLHDVRVRRTRRARNQVAAATAATVAALALGGVVVLPQLSPDATTSAGGAEVLNDSTGAGGSDRDEQGGQAAADTGAPEVVGSLGLDTVATSLLTGPELLALGEGNPQLQVENPGPSFPPLCGATTGAQQYSEPIQELSVRYTVADGSVSQFAAEYSTATAATEAIDRLLVDARNCPDSNPDGRLNVSSRTPGQSLVLSFIEPAAGPNGAPRFSDITIVRTANVLLEVALLPSPSLMALGDGTERARTVAQALAAKLEASTGGD